MIKVLCLQGKNKKFEVGGRFGEFLMFLKRALWLMCCLIAVCFS